MNALVTLLVMSVYAVGCYTILKWAWHQMLGQYWRFTLRRYNGIPLPVLEEWNEEIQWRRERGFTD